MTAAGPKRHHDDGDTPAGYTYVGQFIDHDITFDPTSLREVMVDPESLTNFRTPSLDLDCLYGRGPGADSLYYVRRHPELFQLGMTDGPGVDMSAVPGPFDLQRARFSNFATIPAPRNDENLIVAQLHVAMQRFHNKVVASLPAGLETEARFETARGIVLRHYHAMILEDFLPRILALSAGSNPTAFRR